MEKEERPLLGAHQKIELGKIKRASAARLMSFLLCVGILTAAFAASGMWKDLGQWFGEEADSMGSEKTPSAGNADALLDPPSATDTKEETEDAVEIPVGATPVVSLDLSADWSEGAVLENQTVYRVSEIDLLSIVLKCDGSLSSQEPLVLVLHTHSSEAYLEPNAAYLVGDVGDQIYSDQEDRSVLSVGAALCDTLNKNGIPTVQCSKKHGMDGTLQNAYASSEACIKAYLKRYPSIQYVVDLHRDGILDRSGALVRTEIQKSGESYGQIMAVVGSDGNGTEHPSWEQNLALALQLCSRLNASTEGLCRRASLRNASYNQELAPYSLLLEIGSAGNTQEEAIRSAKLVGEELASMIKEALVS